MKTLSYILIFIISLSWGFSASAANYGGNGYYENALRYIKEKQYDFALMEFRAIIREHPESKHARESLFAVGEYFYMEGAHYEAIKHFSEYLRRYPDSKAAIFARAYLLKIIQDIENAGGQEKGIAENIEMEFFSQPVFLLFSEYKEVSYKSAFQNKFKIRYYIDKIEIYRNGTLFLKITQ